MFSGRDLFKGIACPKADKCDLLNCIFSHNEKQEEIQQRSSNLNTSKSSSVQNKDSVNAPVEGDRKRIKLESGAKASAPSSRPKDSLQSSAVDIPATGESPNASGSKATKSAAGTKLLQSMSRAISPPSKEREIKVPSG